MLTKTILSILLICVASATSDVIYNNNMNCGAGKGNLRDEAVMFSVGRKASFTPTLSNPPITMDYIWTNKGDHYNMDKQRFYAPVTGRYSFSYGAGTEPGKYANLRLFYNDVFVSRAWDYGTSHNGASGNALLELKAGDTVSLRAHGDASGTLAGRDPPVIYFIGILMQKDE